VGDGRRDKGYPADILTRLPQVCLIEAKLYSSAVSIQSHKAVLAVKNSRGLINYSLIV